MTQGRELFRRCGLLLILSAAFVLAGELQNQSDQPKQDQNFPVGAASGAQA